MIPDTHHYRKNVAALIQCQDKFVACHRSDTEAWQCVQGGLESYDVDPKQGIIREIVEELGIDPQQIQIEFQSKNWYRYDFPAFVLQKKSKELAGHIGQEQLWFLVRIPDISAIRLEQSCGEFDRIELLTLVELMASYAQWKKGPLLSFCTELDWMT